MSRRPIIEALKATDSKMLRDAKKGLPRESKMKTMQKSENPMERNNYVEQLRYPGICPRVKNRLRAENIPFEAMHDSITVTPEHFAIAQRITDEVMQEMVQPACTSTDAIQQRIQRKRELAEKCTRYYPVMQTT